MHYYLKTIITTVGSFALDAEKEAHLKIMDYTVKVAMHLFIEGAKYEANIQEDPTLFGRFVQFAVIILGQGFFP